MYKHFFKRLIDIVLSVLGIVILAFPMLVLALIVKIDSPGPVFFKQKRAARGKRYFNIIKFRSMPVSAPKDTPTHQLKNANAMLSRFQRFIRKSSLDELPQLINVLRGDMSLVGPRPELAHFVEKFSSEIPDYEKRHLVKPGITGLAQIRGLRGDTSLSERTSEDLSYIERWSLWLDIKILAMTPFRMLNKKEIYTKGEKKD